MGEPELDGRGPAITTQHDSTDGLSGLDDLMRDERAAPEWRVREDPAIRRRRRRRGWLIVAIILAVVLASTGGYVAWALNAPLPEPVVEWQTPDISVPPAATITMPLEGAAAISVAGADDYLGPEAGGIWKSSGAADPRPMASISKLITALVILDAKPLASADDPGPTIAFGEADRDLFDKYYVLGATVAEMPRGTTMSLHDALATMLIPSASNYAEAVSTWAFGSQGAFVSAAQRWLAANGLTGTTIVEPTGLSARNTSTPSDMIAIGKIAAANPVIAQIAATRSLTLPGPGTMLNTNGVLGTSGITGLKTGTLGENDYTLLYTATLDVGTGQPLSVTGVMLGGFSRDSVSAGVVSLLDSIRAGFHNVPLSERGQQVGTYTTAWGSAGRMIVLDSASILTWSDTPLAVTMDTTAPETYEDGESVGTITWSAGPNTATIDVTLEGGIEQPTAWWRLTHPGELG
ncbi:D-alanyl-D-alanine carboxypeptidase family protein [Microbacterium lacus]|uniref:D-alanyl-D-alanine carboxypeptidase family protein n=1 Tax=Microbacterium lacus TaxID=415217 RepID=UPI001E381507|nr:D-alanyl-D-alanine carboxypeptidase [Microbacterium lacus]